MFFKKIAACDCVQSQVLSVFTWCQWYSVYLRNVTGTDSSKLQCCWCVFKFKFQHSNSSTGPHLKSILHKRTATNPGYQRNRKFWLITVFLFVAYAVENLIVISALKEVSCNAVDFSFHFWACASEEDI